MELHKPHPRLAERVKDHAPANPTFNARLAVFLTTRFGSMAMFYVLVVWMFGWVTLAAAGVGIFKNDPYPFTFLLFLSNLVQLFALPILAVGQQILNRSSEKQAEQTFKDAEAILRIQDEVHRLIEINNKLTEEIHAITVARREK